MTGEWMRENCCAMQPLAHHRVASVASLPYASQEHRFIPGFSLGLSLLDMALDEVCSHVEAQARVEASRCLVTLLNVQSDHSNSKPMQMITQYLHKPLCQPLSPMTGGGAHVAERSDLVRIRYDNTCVPPIQTRRRASSAQTPK